MKIFKKLIVFILPLVVLNLIFLSKNFKANEKSIYDVTKLIKTNFNSDEIKVGCFGTSRINYGIVPSIVDSVFLENKLKSRCLNFGLDGTNAEVTLNITKFYKKTFDIYVIEIFPGLFPLDKNKIKNYTYQEAFGYNLAHFLNQVSIIHNPLFLINYYRKRTLGKFSTFHENGWSQVLIDSNPKRMYLAKEKWKRVVEEGLQNNGYYKDYSQFIVNIKNLSQQNHAAYIFILMPIGGKVKEISYQILQQHDFRKQIKKQIPEALILDANYLERFIDLKTIDDSHLDVKNSIQFSKLLSDTIVKWYHDNFHKSIN